MQKNLNKTISQLLHHEWVGPIPTHDDSFIQQNLYRLYHTIVADLDIEDIRFLINQEILLDDMMPIALGYLRMNILAEGDFYEGDLLNAVLSVSNIFWENHLELKMSLKNIINENLGVIESSDIPRKVIRNTENFLNQNP